MAQTIGALFTERLRALKSRLPAQSIGEIRNLGAMIAIEIAKRGHAAQPDAEADQKLVACASRKGLILLSCGTRANVIRSLPPLTITDALIHEGLDILEACFNEAGTEA